MNLLLFIQMEVHILLLTDMLLICKPSTKKTSSGLTGTVGGGLKIIRQPYVIDRIRIHELKEPTSLGLVYLNEYGAASAALVLSAGESKLAKVYILLVCETYTFFLSYPCIYIYIQLFTVLDGIDQESSTTICVNESATAWQHDELDHGH